MDTSQKIGVGNATKLFTSQCDTMAVQPKYPIGASVVTVPTTSAPTECVLVSGPRTFIRCHQVECEVEGTCTPQSCTRRWRVHVLPNHVLGTLVT